MGGDKLFYVGQMEGVVCYAFFKIWFGLHHSQVGAIIGQVLRIQSQKLYFMYRKKL